MCTLWTKKIATNAQEGQIYNKFLRNWRKKPSFSLPFHLFSHNLEFVGWGSGSRIWHLNRAPRNDLAVFLHDLSLVINKHERVVRVLLRVLLVPLPGEREDASHADLFADGAEFVRLRTWDGACRLHHLRLVVHDALRRVLRENDEVHARQAHLAAAHHVADALDVRHHLRRRGTVGRACELRNVSTCTVALTVASAQTAPCTLAQSGNPESCCAAGFYYTYLLVSVQAWHLVLEDAHSDGVGRAGDVAMSGHCCWF